MKEKGWDLVYDRASDLYVMTWDGKQYGELGFETPKDAIDALAGMLLAARALHESYVS